MGRMYGGVRTLMLRIRSHADLKRSRGDDRPIRQRLVHADRASSAYDRRFMRPLELVATALAMASIAGCGSKEIATTRPSVAVKGPAGYYHKSRLEQRMSNAFRSGLYRLAVMSQPGEAAVDLGQQLPTGKLGSMDCEPAGAAPANRRDWPWRCDVRWRTVEGKARRTRYDVVLTASSCYAAEAKPHYDAILDSTINATSEHPLNTFGRQLGKC